MPGTESISPEYIKALLDNKVSERKNIDYKRDLPGGTDKDKKEFLADVSSFANSEGGDLIFGIDESSGVPTGIVGVAVSNTDAEKLRLQNLIRDGLQPRLPSPPEMECISIGKANPVLLIRTRRSWRSPHRVSFGGHGHFYARNSSGKYQLDVGELRDAMIRGETVTERIRTFRAERVIAVKSGATPVDVEDVPRQVIHIVPLSAFATAESADISMAIRNIASSNLHALRPLGRPTGLDHRVNLEGRVVFGATNSGEPNSRSYTEYYRNGIVEAVGTLPVLSKASPDFPYIACQDWVYELRDFLGRSFLLLKRLESSFSTLPIVCFFSLIGIQGISVSVDRYIGAIGNAFKVDDIILREELLETHPSSPDQLLKRILGMVWNAAGLEDCSLFGKDGKLLPQDQ